MQETVIVAADRGYMEWPVDPALADHVVCTWRDSPRPARGPVLPDACIDVVWDGHVVFVAGPDTGASVTEGDATFVGIRFRPGAGPAFLGVPAIELLDSRVPLQDLWGRPATEQLCEQLLTAPERATRRLETALLARLSAIQTPDGLVTATVGLLSYERAARSDVVGLAGELGVSERTLRRRCADALGYGPKTLERILRFRRALRLLRDGYASAETALLAGYTDQAHQTNEFRKLANATPGALSRHGGPLSSNGYN